MRGEKHCLTDRELELPACTGGSANLGGLWQKTQGKGLGTRGWGLGTETGLAAGDSGEG
jgi:hypothetical protein